MFIFFCLFLSAYIKGGPLAHFLDDERGTLAILVELSRLRMWQSALAQDESPVLSVQDLEHLQDKLSKVRIGDCEEEEWGRMNPYYYYYSFFFPHVLPIPETLTTGGRSTF